MAGKKKKTTTIVEEIPPGDSPLELESGETSEFDLDLHRAEDAETVDQILKDNGISNVLYRFYDNDGGYCYSSPELDYDRARRETKGGKHCKLGVFVGNKLMRMVPFPLAPLDPATTPILSQQPTSDISFLKDLLLKILERPAATAAPVPTVTELISGIAALDNLRGKQESAMDLFQKGIEFAQTANGSADWKTDALRTVRDIAPQIMGAFNMRNGGGLPANTENQQPELPPDSIIKSGIQYLKKKAIAGVDPELIVEWVASNAEEYEPILRVVLNQEFSDFVKFDPEIGTEPFVSWFKPLFDGLRSAFKQPDSVDDDSGGSVGNASNARGDGKPSANGSAKPKS